MIPFHDYYLWRQWQRVRRIVADAPNMQQDSSYVEAVKIIKEMAVQPTTELQDAKTQIASSQLDLEPLRVYVDQSIEPSLSIRRYFDFLAPQLTALGVIWGSDRSTADLEWNPYGGWTAPPPPANGNLPYLCTFHGAKGWFVDWDWDYPDRDSALQLQPYVMRQFQSWRERIDSVDAFIVPSFYAGAELCESLGCPEDLISVIHHGLDHTVYLPDGQKKESVGFLHVVAHWRAIKNIERIIAAHQASKSPIPLTIIAHNWSPDKLPPLVNHVQGPLTPQDLASYYRGATALVFATLSETFGLPAVEAMACGCPVITSNNSAMRELFEGSAITVDPFSEQDIAQAMRKITTTELATTYRERGILRARSFTWERSARAHLRLFRRLHQEHKARQNPGQEKSIGRWWKKLRH